MEAATRRTIGWALAAIGAVVAVVGGLADQLGLGGEGENEFGTKQVVALAVGLVILAAGLAAAMLRPRS